MPTQLTKQAAFTSEGVELGYNPQSRRLPAEAGQTVPDISFVFRWYRRPHAITSARLLRPEVQANPGRRGTSLVSISARQPDLWPEGMHGSSRGKRARFKRVTVGR